MQVGFQGCYYGGIEDGVMVHLSRYLWVHTTQLISFCIIIHRVSRYVTSNLELIPVISKRRVLARLIFCWGRIVFIVNIHHLKSMWKILLCQ